MNELLELLQEVQETGAWAELALCAQTDPEVFFPPIGAHGHEAKAVCSRCPVAAECLLDALERNEPYGIWGGLNVNERAAVKRRMGLTKEQER